MPHVHRKQHPKHQQSPSGNEVSDLGLLFFKADGSQVTIQHCSAHGDGSSSRPATVPSMRLDLRTGKVWVGPAGPLPADSPMTLGIFGLLRLERGTILVLVSKAKRVCGMLDGPVYKVEDTTLVAPETINSCANDLRYASLLQEAVSPKCVGAHLYFSHTANITSSRQRQALASSTSTGTSPAGQRTASDGGSGWPPSLGAWWANDGAVTAAPGRNSTADGSSGSGSGASRGIRGGGSGGGSLWSRADPRFLWNRELMRPLIEAGADAFALPIMAGYVGQATGATFVLRSNSSSNIGKNCTNSERDNGRDLATIAAHAGDNGGGADAGGFPSTSASPPSQTQKHEPQRNRQHGSVDAGSDDISDTVAGRAGGGERAAVRAPADLTLVTRLGVERPVAGGWRRGADTQGHTAGFAETEVVLTVWQPEENDLASATATAAASDTDTAATATATATAASPSSTANPKQDSQQQQQQPQQRLGETGDKGKGSDAPGETGPKGGCSPRSGSVAVSDSSTCVRKRTWVAVTSYVIARGSAPLFWAAPPDMRLCPAPRGPEDPVLHSGPFTRHVDWLHAAYGRTLLLLNIIFGSNERQQLRLHDALKQQVDAYCARVRDQRRKQQQQQLQVESRNEHQATSREGEDIATGEGRGEDGDTSGAAAVAVASAGSATAPGAVSGRSTNNPEVASSLSLVGLLLRSGELSELASCGAAAAHLEREVAEAARRIGAFVSLDELEMTVMQQPSTAATNANGTRTAATSTATKTTTANSPMVASDPQPQPQPQSLRGRSMTRCVGRQVCCLQKGLLRVSSASTVSAGGCCEEVDLAQHALVLPVLAEALVAMGAMDDPGDMGVAHGSVIHALAQLWSHMADVLSDQTLGTASHAGRVLRAAAAAMEPPSLARWVVKGLWDKILSVGDTASRYYYSNFTDARRQDALDLSSGVFKMSSPPAELPRRKPPSTTTLQLGILLVLAATIQAVVLAFKRSVGLKELGTGVLGPAALGVALLLEVLRQGTAYVEQPLLQRTGLYPWAQ